MQGTGCTPPEARFSLAQGIRDGTIPVRLGGRLVPEADLPALFMNFDHGIGYVHRTVPLSPRGGFIKTPPPGDYPGHMPAEYDGEPLTIDADAVHRALDRSTPVAPASRKAGPGREADFDWEYACARAWAWREDNGYPDAALTGLIAFLVDALEAKHGKAPDPSTVRKRLRKWMRLHPNVAGSK